MDTAIIATNCPDLKLLNRGKVRDMYAIPGHDDKLLMVATDRISAFDVIMAEPVPFPCSGSICCGMSCQTT